MGYRVRKDKGRISKTRSVKRPTSKDLPISYLQKCVGGEGTKLIHQAIIDCWTHMRLKLLLDIWSSLLRTLLCELIRRLCIIVPIMREVRLTITVTIEYSTGWPASLVPSSFLPFLYLLLCSCTISMIEKCKGKFIMFINIYLLHKYSTIDTIFEIYLKNLCMYMLGIKFLIKFDTWRNTSHEMCDWYIKFYIV